MIAIWCNGRTCAKIKNRAFAARLIVMTPTEETPSFRLVCKKEQRKAVKALLAAEGFCFEDEPFSDYCCRLVSRQLPLGSSLAAFFGYIYIQNRSSMLPPLMLAPQKGAVVLDMCASPGGKSTFLGQLTGENGFVLANEPNPERFATLQANIRRLNLFQVGASRYDARMLPIQENTLDSILLDPPCSGWGTAKKNPITLKIWQGGKIAPLAALQRQLLQKAAQILAPGGQLVYSTCTTNPQENEMQAQYAARELGLKTVALKPVPGFVFNETALGQGYLLVDGEASKAQGFFVALLRKPGQAKHVAEAAASTADAMPDLANFPLPGRGRAQIIGDTARFLGEGGQKFGQNVSWQGPTLGKWRPDKGFTPDARLRHEALLAIEDLPKTVFEETSRIRAFLSGQAMRTELNAPMSSIWWRDLPLGLAKIRDKRLINQFK